MNFQSLPTLSLRDPATRPKLQDALNNYHVSFRPTGEILVSTTGRDLSLKVPRFASGRPRRISRSARNDKLFRTSLISGYLSILPNMGLKMNFQSPAYPVAARPRYPAWKYTLRDCFATLQWHGGELR